MKGRQSQVFLLDLCFESRASSPPQLGGWRRPRVAQAVVSSGLRSPEGTGLEGANGTESESDWYPFGGERVISDTLPSPNHYKFTGMERDTETGLDHTLYRQFSSSYGRWYSPDRMVGNVLNPQSWNRYAYVTNNPATLTDPLGLGNVDPRCASSYAGCPTNVPDASTDTNQVSFVAANLATQAESIFNALEGEPGTYLTVDQEGNIAAGFSVALWQLAHVLVDTISSESVLMGSYPGGPAVGTLSATDLGAIGLVTILQDGLMTGPIADFYAAAQALVNVAVDNPDAFPGFLTTISNKGPQEAQKEYPEIYSQYESAVSKFEAAMEEVGSALAGQRTGKFTPASASAP
jgi:RHS repeat-associated protein